MGHRWIGWFEVILGLGLTGCGLFSVVRDFTSPYAQGIGFAYGTAMVVVSIIALRAGILLLHGSASGRRASIAVMKLFLSIIALSFVSVFQSILGGHKLDGRELAATSILTLLSAVFIYAWSCLRRSTQ